MRVFLSHTSYDAGVVEYLRSLLEHELGVEFFLLPDDAPHGLPWIEQIKLGVENSDELFTVVTPESVHRPWVSAEWACFWMQGKPTTPLLLEVGVDQLWEPMRAFQTVDLLEVSSSTRFLRAIADRTGCEPTSGVTPVAHQMVREIPRIRERQAVADLERTLERLQRTVTANHTNVRAGDVRALIARDRLDDLIAISISAQAAQVKQKQIAVHLVDLGRFGEAARIGEHMQNRAEIRNICLQIVKAIPRGATGSSDEWAALDRLHPKLGKPQRRDVLEFMDRNGVAPLGRWAPADSLDEGGG